MNINFTDKFLTTASGSVYSLNGLAIIVSPHQDDESIGMGGTIALLISSGFAVYFIFTTIEPTKQAYLRKNEAKRAIAELGGQLSNITFLDLPDGDSKSFVLNFSKSVGKMKKKIQEIELACNVITLGENSKEILLGNKHTLILTTSRHDAHRDHEETFNMIKNGVRKKIIMEFPVINHMSSDFTTNCLIEIPDAVYEIKRKSLERYTGENKKGRIMVEDIEALMLENGKIIGKKRAESCFIGWYGYLKPLN